MEKIKFTIKGMTCPSCAKLIEEKFKDEKGIFSAKVSLESKKAVVAYDEKKTDKAEIFQVVQSAGDFNPEEIKEEEKLPLEPISQANEALSPQISNTLSDKRSFINGLIAGFGVVSFVVAVVLALMLMNNSNNTSGNRVALAQNNPTQAPTPNTPSAPTIPAPDPSSIQTFNITKDDHVRGAFNAPITLVEFSDFECPFCGRIYPTFKSILSKYDGKVRLVYKYFPLSFHPNAQKAAEAAECANEQGKFWEYHDKLFDNQAVGFSLDNFKSWAKDLGLDSSKFNNCLDSGKYADKVQADEKEGAAKGVRGTPATFINGQLVSGALPLDSFTQIIDGLIK